MTAAEARREVERLQRLGMAPLYDEIKAAVQRRERVLRLAVGQVDDEALKLLEADGYDVKVRRKWADDGERQEQWLEVTW